MKETFSLDKKITQIRNIVEEMQRGMIDFDAQMKKFREASQLIKECQKHLAQTELEVQQLINEEWASVKTPPES